MELYIWGIKALSQRPKVCKNWNLRKGENSGRSRYQLTPPETAGYYEEEGKAQESTVKSSSARRFLAGVVPARHLTTLSYNFSEINVNFLVPVLLISPSDPFQTQLRAVQMQ